MARKKTTTTKVSPPPRRKPAAGKKKKGSARKRAPLTAARVRLLGLNCDNMAEAESQCEKLAGPLADILAEFSALQAAWQRGRFLRQLRTLAATAVSVSEAARAMGMDGLELRALLDTDSEAADLWNNARIATLVEVKAAMVESAKEGRPAAIKQIEQLLRREIAAPAADFGHVTISQMCELTGKTRQTIHDWHTKYGLTRNSDQTFNLREFLVWFEHFTLQKRTPGKPAFPMDPLKAAKAEKLEIELQQQRGQLLDREAVLAGTLARHQNLINALDRQAEELAMLCHNQPPDKITQILERFFEGIRAQQCEISEQLRLPAGLARQFADLLARLRPEGQKDEQEEPS